MQTFVVFQAKQADRRPGNGNFKIPAASFPVFQMFDSYSMDTNIWSDHDTIYSKNHKERRWYHSPSEDGRWQSHRNRHCYFIRLSGEIENNHSSYRANCGECTENRQHFIAESQLVNTSGRTSRDSEAFTVIAEVEFFYKQFPEDMRSFAGLSCFMVLQCLVIWAVSWYQWSPGRPKMHQGEIGCMKT